LKIFLPKSAVSIFLSQKDIFSFSFCSSNRWFFDKNALITQICKWNSQLPWIKSYYAIKSNPSLEIIKTLLFNEFSITNPVGLDAASANELILSLNLTNSNNIIYTNPHIIPHEKKTLSRLLNNINIKVVDSLCEVKKMIEYNINVDILIRLKSNIRVANVQFDSKFGCSVEEAFEIIDYLKTSHSKDKIKIKGISFHVGSGGDFKREDAYKMAITYAMPLLNYLENDFKNKINENTEKPILDIGGGLLYDTNLEEALGWTKDLPYTIIAELGRYYAEPSYHLALQIIAETERGIFLDNGVYHELNGFHRDHWEFPDLTHCYDSNSGKIEEIKEYKTVKIFGPTCDSYDNIGECKFPKKYDVEDWILMNNMGAYTSAGKVDFNGIKGASSQ